MVAGPRQCGKTTLARPVVDSDSVKSFDLESPPSLVRLDEPMAALVPLRGTDVIDEVQLRPDLCPAPRMFLDRPDAQAKYLFLGGGVGNLLRQSSASLAGRDQYLRTPKNTA
ncbi:MAG: AAA family ATPase [Albidovulum sp.]|nr:AAA family ATPase [Albidovulum sp.]